MSFVRPTKGGQNPYVDEPFVPTGTKTEETNTDKDPTEPTGPTGPTEPTVPVTEQKEEDDRFIRESKMFSLHRGLINDIEDHIYKLKQQNIKIYDPVSKTERKASPSLWVKRALQEALDREGYKRDQ